VFRLAASRNPEHSSTGVIDHGEPQNNDPPQPALFDLLKLQNSHSSQLA
jgi:hypothetical protein